MEANGGRNRAHALIRQVLAIGADARISIADRLSRLAELARRTFAAERAWIVHTDLARHEQHLTEACDPAFPGASITGELVPLEAFDPQFAALRAAGKPLLFVAPFPELPPEARELLRRYHVEACAKVLSRATGDDSLWLVGLDFCRSLPTWKAEDTELLQEFGDAIAIIAEAAQLFVAAEAARRDLEIVFNAQRDGVAMIDASGKILRCNQAYTGMLHRAPRRQDHGFEPCCIAGSDLGEERCALHQARETGEGRATVFSERPGDARWLQCMVQRVAGDPDLFLHTLRDVTQQRVLSERAAQQARLESLGTLAGGVAHEFNNILMGMGPAVERLRHAASSDPEALELITAAVERAGELTRRMLALSRQQAGFVGRCQLAKALREIVAVLRSSLPKNIHVSLEVRGDVGWVGLEAGALDSVFLNLATNSRDAMPDGGSLSFAARREETADGPVAVVVVADTGVGIRAADLARIFDPFFTTKAAGGGTGLGLPLVHRLVTEAAGSISVGSAGEGQGTTFTISLPIVAPLHTAEPAPPASLAPGRLDGRRILVVDDEEPIRDGIAFLLREAGAEVAACDSGEEALVRFADSSPPFDVAVADFGLPGIDGCTLLGELLAIRPQLVAVLASGYTDTQRFTNLQDRGVLFFQKPFQVGDLIRALAARLR
ncbi:MAG TPA: ATP-binding protein [Thermoanaerobaculaceae bacterium]|nr:ATP-binding protein [Thermoanaerobaculaceae bacterium]